LVRAVAGVPPWFDEELTGAALVGWGAGEGPLDVEGLTGVDPGRLEVRLEVPSAAAEDDEEVPCPPLGERLPMEAAWSCCESRWGELALKPERAAASPARPLSVEAEVPCLGDCSFAETGGCGEPPEELVGAADRESNVTYLVPLAFFPFPPLPIRAKGERCKRRAAGKRGLRCFRSFFEFFGSPREINKLFSLNRQIQTYARAKEFICSKVDAWREINPGCLN